MSWRSRNHPGSGRHLYRVYSSSATLEFLEQLDRKQPFSRHICQVQYSGKGDGALCRFVETPNCVRSGCPRFKTPIQNTIRNDELSCPSITKRRLFDLKNRRKRKTNPRDFPQIKSVALAQNLTKFAAIFCTRNLTLFSVTELQEKSSSLFSTFWSIFFYQPNRRECELCGRKGDKTMLTPITFEPFLAIIRAIFGF